MEIQLFTRSDAAQSNAIAENKLKLFFLFTRQTFKWRWWQTFCFVWANFSRAVESHQSLVRVFSSRFHCQNAVINCNDWKFSLTIDVAPENYWPVLGHDIEKLKNLGHRERKKRLLPPGNWKERQRWWREDASQLAICQHRWTWNEREQIPQRHLQAHGQRESLRKKLNYRQPKSKRVLEEAFCDGRHEMCAN